MSPQKIHTTFPKYLICWHAPLHYQHVNSGASDNIMRTCISQSRVSLTPFLKCIIMNLGLVWWSDNKESLIKSIAQQAQTTRGPVRVAQHLYERVDVKKQTWRPFWWSWHSRNCQHRPMLLTSKLLSVKRTLLVANENGRSTISNLRRRRRRDHTSLLQCSQAFHGVQTETCIKTAQKHSVIWTFVRSIIGAFLWFRAGRASHDTICRGSSGWHTGLVRSA